MSTPQNDLYRAIINANAEQVKRLLDLGVDPNFVFNTLTPLHWAINSCYNNNDGDSNEHIYKDIVKLLIDKSDLNLKCHGYTPIQFAEYTQCHKLINIMKRKK